MAPRGLAEAGTWCWRRIHDVLIVIVLVIEDDCKGVEKERDRDSALGFGSLELHGNHLTRETL